MESASKLSALAQPFSALEMLKNPGLDCLIYFCKLIRLFLRKAYMPQLFLILRHRKNYLDVNFRLLHLRVQQLCHLVLMKLFHLPSQRQNKNVDVHIVVNDLPVVLLL